MHVFPFGVLAADGAEERGHEVDLEEVGLEAVERHDAHAHAADGVSHVLPGVL